LSECIGKSRSDIHNDVMKMWQVFINSAIVETVSAQTEFEEGY